MYLVLVVTIILLFLGLLFLNIYFRVRVFKAYRKLQQRGIKFDGRHMLNKQKLEAEILPRYPDSREDILQFVHNIRNSIRLASFLIALITLFGAVLMYYR